MTVTRILLVHTNSTDDIHAFDDLSKHNLYKIVKKEGNRRRQEGLHGVHQAS